MTAKLSPMRLALLLFALTGPAFAYTESCGDGCSLWGSGPTITFQSTDVMSTYIDENKLIFHMSNGACVLGPLEIFNPNTGRPIFMLETKKDWPPGCSKR